MLAARLVRHNVKKTAEEWLAEEEAEDRASSAYDLATCGHVFLELGLKERSERCFTISSRLLPGPAEAARALHLSETRPQQALTDLEPITRQSEHQSVLGAMGIVLHRLGRDREALPWLEHALAKDPTDWRARAATADVCQRLAEPECEKRVRVKAWSMVVTH